MDVSETSTYVAPAEKSVRKLAFVTLSFLVAIAATEVTFAFVGPTVGIVCAAVVTAALLGVAVLERSTENAAEFREPLQALDVLPILALVPLLRIVSLTIPVRDLPQIYWYAVTGAPMLVAIGLSGWFFGASWSRDTFVFRWSRSQALIGLGGVPVGLIAYLILRPGRIEPHLTPQFVVLGVLILIPFNALMEELLFRAALQRILVTLFGDLGTAAAAVLFMTTYLGTRSAPYIALVGLTGFALGHCVRQTGSIAGAVAAHALISVGLILVWPYTIG